MNVWDLEKSTPKLLSSLILLFKYFSMILLSHLCCIAIQYQFSNITNEIKFTLYTYKRIKERNNQQAPSIWKYEHDTHLCTIPHSTYPTLQNYDPSSTLWNIYHLYRMAIHFLAQKTQSAISYILCICSSKMEHILDYANIFHLVPILLYHL